MKPGQYFKNTHRNQPVDPKKPLNQEPQRPPNPPLRMPPDKFAVSTQEAQGPPHFSNATNLTRTTVSARIDRLMTCWPDTEKQQFHQNVKLAILENEKRLNHQMGPKRNNGLSVTPHGLALLCGQRRHVSFILGVAVAVASS